MGGGAAFRGIVASCKSKPEVLLIGHFWGAFGNEFLEGNCVPYVL